LVAGRQGVGHHALAAAAGVARLAGWSATHALVLGVCACASSTLFGERLALAPGFGAQARQRATAILLGEDAGSVALFAALVVLGGAAAGAWPLFLGVVRLALIATVLAAASRLVVPRLLDAVARRHAQELVLLATLAVLATFAAAGWLAGAAPIGAFLAGIACGEASSRFVVRNALVPVRDAALAAFLLLMGLMVDISVLVQHLPVAVGVSLVFVAAKLAANVPLALAAGLDAPGSARVGLALSTLGELGLILTLVAGRQGVGHHALAAVIVGALLSALLLSTVLLHGLPWLERAAARLPAGTRRPLRMLLGAARTPAARSPAQREVEREAARARVRTLVANLLVVLLVLAAAGALAPRAEAWRVLGRAYLGPMLTIGLGIAVSAPFVAGAYHAYRHLVRVMLHVEDPGGRAARLRQRLVDAWVATTVLMLLIPVFLFVPATLPVLLGGFFLAVAIAAVAWRQLGLLQDTLQGTVERVLGASPETGALLDQILQKYPWGVRFAAVPVPPGSPVAGQSLERARIPDLTGAAVAVVQRRHREIVNPEKDQVLLVGDTIILMGEPHQLARAEALIVAHGEALRLTAQSRVARVVEVDVTAESPLAGLTLGQADLKNRTGTLVVGIKPHHAEHPMPFRPDLVIRPGDQLLLLGTPLQTERARLLCEGVPEGKAGADRLAGSQSHPGGWGENA
ncbi:MAG TPA: TrkA C-terminal domain-containing protein, partial [Candidatus Thermoplasmatota archaeon]|nr:TrkA C-terminal domain-containing protein [Candidatus Thermoplasmatota archaeon]